MTVSREMSAPRDDIIYNSRYGRRRHVVAAPRTNKYRDQRRSVWVGDGIGDTRDPPVSALSVLSRGVN